jgi:hypothetical protein
MEGALQDNNRADDNKIRSALRVKSFREFILSPGSVPLRIM